MEELRVSVRELVEFTLHGADIRLISGRMQDMPVSYTHLTLPTIA